LFILIPQLSSDNLLHTAKKAVYVAVYLHLDF